jgi:hypothetical protein
MFLAFKCISADRGSGAAAGFPPVFDVQFTNFIRARIKFKSEHRGSGAAEVAGGIGR